MIVEHIRESELGLATQKLIGKVGLSLAQLSPSLFIIYYCVVYNYLNLGLDQ